ncbi:TBC1 domain family member 22B-like [Watersipora subatra]|uniref:TBC1 domain family member 22B-like n=1 Tax=Watersipora subatra TaxID=2589382 RepID=UPI00355C0C63
MSKDICDDFSFETSFWKPNLKPLPGSVFKVTCASTSSEGHCNEQPHIKSLEINGATRTTSSNMAASPRKNAKSSATSFKQYEASTQDAWDDGDDDLLVRLRLDTNIIQSTANLVIDSHNTSAPPNLISIPAVQTPQKVSNGRSESTSHSQSGAPQRNGASGQRSISKAQSERELAKQKKFEALLNSPPKNLLEELRPLSWSGIPASCRPTTWRFLSGYLPAALDRRDLTLERKRQEYFGFLDQYFGTRHQDQYEEIFRQIHIDVPRMNPLIPLFQNKQVQEIFERILYIWAIRHPASGYVQGINDLVTPFFVVFLSESIDADVESENVDISGLSKDQLNMIEADSFWCMSKLLDGIQDNYTFAQPGIQKKVSALKELTHRIDSNLHQHIENQGIEFLQFTFRWMNNLLMRELPLRCTIRLWDTYLAEPDGFADYHLYVCAAFLTKFSKQLIQQQDFQTLMTLLQNLPTDKWNDEDIGELTAEAYRLKYMFAGAPQHYKTS